MAIFLFSVTLHEASHAWVAYRSGDLSAYMSGQVSLNPMPHIRREPIGMVVLPLLSLAFLNLPLGFAATPYDPQWANTYPKRAAIMALAGPLSNLIVAVVCVIVLWIGMNMEIFHMDQARFVQLVRADGPGLANSLSILLSMLLFINFLLFFLNMIPVPPLDGAATWTVFMHDDTARRFNGFINQPAVSIMGLLMAFFLVQTLFPVAYYLFLSIFFNIAPG